MDTPRTHVIGSSFGNMWPVGVPSVSDQVAALEESEMKSGKPFETEQIQDGHLWPPALAGEHFHESDGADRVFELRLGQAIVRYATLLPHPIRLMRAIRHDLVGEGRVQTKTLALYGVTRAKEYLQGHPDREMYGKNPFSQSPGNPVDEGGEDAMVISMDAARSGDAEALDLLARPTFDASQVATRLSRLRTTTSATTSEEFADVIARAFPEATLREVLSHWYVRTFARACHMTTLELANAENPTNIVSRLFKRGDAELAASAYDVLIERFKIESHGASWHVYETGGEWDPKFEVLMTYTDVSDTVVTVQKGGYTGNVRLVVSTPETRVMVEKKTWPFHPNWRGEDVDDQFYLGARACYEAAYSTYDTESGGGTYYVSLSPEAMNLVRAAIARAAEPDKVAAE